jgi:hypothetical protein
LLAAVNQFSLQLNLSVSLQLLINICPFKHLFQVSNFLLQSSYIVSFLLKFLNSDVVGLSGIVE